MRRGPRFRVCIAIPLHPTGLVPPPPPGLGARILNKKTASLSFKGTLSAARTATPGHAWPRTATPFRELLAGWRAGRGAAPGPGRRPGRCRKKGRRAGERLATRSPGTAPARDGATSSSITPAPPRPARSVIDWPGLHTHVETRCVIPMQKIKKCKFLKNIFKKNLSLDDKL